MTGDPDFDRERRIQDSMAAVEAERRRLAELLNHHVVNPLNLLLAQANAYEQTFGTNPQARMAVSVLASLARQIMQQTRDLQANLNPTILEALGLEAALEALASQFTRTYGLSVTLKMDRLRERLPFQIELVLFRAAQDGLDRLVNQVHASQAAIRLESRDETLLIFTLTDDGVINTGFDRFNAIRQRIEQLGGVFDAHADAQGVGVLTIRFALKPPIELTAREMDVIQFAAEGLTNKEIAIKLTLSARTVNFHLDNIYSKLGVSTRTEAAIYALRQGWIKRPD